jgi:hypothetical protein
LLLEAAMLLAIARLAVLLVPFRYIAGRLGEQMAESSREVAAAHVSMIEDISWAIAAAARHLPWDRCLVTAIAAMMMLSRRRIPATFYLGMGRHKDQVMQAHAWVRAGDSIIAGAEESERHTVIASFASGPAEAEEY